VQIFFSLFEEKISKSLDQLYISRISGLTGYPAGQFGIRSDTGYKKGRIIRPDIRLAGYPVHP
jgi:hypothetical protein